jgi:hypothetical protein
VLGPLREQEIAGGEDGDRGAERDHRRGVPAGGPVTTARMRVVHELGFLSNLPELAIGVPLIY